MCHSTNRDRILGLEDFETPNLTEAIDLNLRLARRTNPAVRCAGVALNTSELTAAEAQTVLRSSTGSGSRWQIPYGGVSSLRVWPTRVSRSRSEEGVLSGTPNLSFYRSGSPSTVRGMPRGDRLRDNSLKRSPSRRRAAALPGRRVSRTVHIDRARHVSAPRATYPCPIRLSK